MNQSDLAPESTRLPPLAMIIAFLVLSRLAIAFFLPLAVDEAHAIAVAREFSWAFFDHPPIGFWSPVISANLFGVEAPFIYRLPDVLYGFGAAWMMYLIGTRLGGKTAGIWTLGLVAISPAFMVGGIAIIPDGPLYLGLSVCIYWMIRIAQCNDKPPFSFWIGAGLGLAFAMASKYQAGLIPITLFLFAIFSPKARNWFTQPGAYAAACLGLIGLLPVLVWNIQNDWASLEWQVGRTARGIYGANFAAMLVGQFVYLLPPILIVGLVGAIRATRGNLSICMVGWLALFQIVFFNIVFLTGPKTFPHWALPGWMFTLPLAGVMLAVATDAARLRARRWISGFGVIGVILIVVVISHARSGALTNFTHDTPPAWDRTLEVFDYSMLKPELEARGDLEDVDVILAQGWIEGSFVSTALHGEYPTRVFTKPHHFKFMKADKAVGQALYLEPVLLMDIETARASFEKRVKNLAPDATFLDPVILKRGPRDYAAVLVARLEITK